MAEPVVVHEDERGWEAWPPEQVEGRGRAKWKTLFSAGTTPTDALTLGIAYLAPGEALAEHHHQQPEVYFVLEGAGIVTLEGEPRDLTPGTGVFIPGGARHSVASTGDVDLRIAYALAADSFDDVTYVF